MVPCQVSGIPDPVPTATFPFRFRAYRKGKGLGKALIAGQGCSYIAPMLKEGVVAKTGCGQQNLASSQALAGSRGSHLRTACTFGCDRDQDEINRSRPILRPIKRSRRAAGTPINDQALFLAGSVVT